MSRAGVPVPPGFTIATDVCNLYFAAGNRTPSGVEREMKRAVRELEKESGQKLGDSDNPLLVSVRSGAKFSMPGMMDTILNLGLNDKTTAGLARKSDNPRFARDCYRRFIQMFGNVVLEIDKEDFEHIFESVKKKKKAKLDTDLTAADLELVIADYKKLVKKKTNKPFSQDPYRQLQMARDAVFGSWFNPRANHYRRMNGIAEDLGTAVNVQTMVFGNLGETSATGVGFTRNPATGENRFYGEFLINAQGEDVVAGIRTPRPISELKRIMPQAYGELNRITGNLEKALPRHPGLRVYDSGVEALHVADPQRQAHWPGRRPHRCRDGGRRAHLEAGSGFTGRAAPARATATPGTGAQVEKATPTTGERVARLAGRRRRQDRFHCG